MVIIDDRRIGRTREGRLPLGLLQAYLKRKNRVHQSRCTRLATESSILGILGIKKEHFCSQTAPRLGANL